MIVDDIVKDCNKSPCFGFIADEATDCATIEQMALCVRFYDIDQCIIREDFIGFGECLRTTGEALTHGFLQTLTEKGIIIQTRGPRGPVSLHGHYKGKNQISKQPCPLVAICFTNHHG